MSFEITYETLSKPHFRTGLSKVLNTETKDFKIAYNMGRVGDLLDQQHREAKRVFEKLAKSHGVINKDNNNLDITEDKKEAWDKAHEEFLAHSVKVERHKIRVEDINGVPLTPLELTALEPILSGLDGLTD